MEFARRDLKLSARWLGDERLPETARVWIGATGEQLAIIRGHEDVVNSASFSLDGKQIITAI